jgi:hypothetical protein
MSKIENPESAKGQRMLEPGEEVTGTQAVTAMAKGRRITVDLTASAGSELARLKKVSGLSTAELFRHAFNLLRLYVAAKDEGNEMYVSDRGGKDRVIELPFLVSRDSGR